MKNLKTLSAIKGKIRKIALGPRLYIIFFLAIVSIFIGCGYNYSNIYVTHIYDGDTVKLANGEKLRFIGIDCPELYESDKLYRDAQQTGEDMEAIQAMGKESSNFTSNLIMGKRIRLEFDIEKRDKYGRLLAYAYLSDGTFVNAMIIEQGYAQPMTIPPNIKYADLFQELYQSARKDKKGLWKEKWTKK